MINGVTKCLEKRKEKIIRMKRAHLRLFISKENEWEKSYKATGIFTMLMMFCLHRNGQLVSFRNEFN